MNSSPVQKIKEILSIEEVVSSYIKLERAGGSLKARCPFHSEKTPSFFVSSDRGSYYCFGCGASGDIFSFVEEFEGLDFKGALKLLAQRAGVPLTYQRGTKQEIDEKEELFKVMEEASLFFERNLELNEEALSYLKRRGVTEKAIKDFRIGFISEAWELLYNHLKSKNFKDSIIQLAGLAKKGKSGKIYDRFRGRIMFPISDSSGRIVAFSGRLFVENDKAPKYLNSPETAIYNKSSILHGIDKAKSSIRKNNFSILVEGQFDLIMSHIAGFSNTVSTSGTALSENLLSKEKNSSNLALIRRLSGNIVIAFDADSAGVKASNRASKIALSLGMNVKVANLEEGKDPADCILEKGSEAWKKVIRESVHIIDFLIRRILEKNISDPHKLADRIKEDVLPFVKAIDSAMEKSLFVSKISDQTGISVDSLKEDLKKVEALDFYVYENTESKALNKGNKASLKRTSKILKTITGIIFWQKELKQPRVDLEELYSSLDKILGKKVEDIEKEFYSEKNNLLFEAEAFYQEHDKEELEKELTVLLNNLEEEFLKEKLVKKIINLKKSESQKDKLEAEKILEEINFINKRVEELRGAGLG